MHRDAQYEPAAPSPPPPKRRAEGRAPQDKSGQGAQENSEGRGVPKVDPGAVHFRAKNGCEGDGRAGFRELRAGQRSPRTSSNALLVEKARTRIADASTLFLGGAGAIYCQAGQFDLESQAFRRAVISTRALGAKLTSRRFPFGERTTRARRPRPSKTSPAD